MQGGSFQKSHTEPALELCTETVVGYSGNCR